MHPHTTARPRLVDRHPTPHTGVAPALLMAVLGFLLFSGWMYAPQWDRALPQRLGTWLALSFFVLALDEQFMLHELWKFRCHEWTDACRWSAVREAPMLAVAVVGLLTMAWLHRALWHPGTRALLWAGLAVGWLAIGVDQWPEVQACWPRLPDLPSLLATLEEGLEVVAEALVLGALLRQPGQ
ncbi:hypothetical protein C8C96_1002 [Acidovorax sp. 100]|uniref:hypothetical protein n=1 Tax=Acidovorax sp. 100 TaxID=2135635 RepID=UPI000EF998B0|nr:hypothetical protein [Acidovorax sp. 100]RMA59988.1 hypothetical protein C8C96_1002 [Acidovorax sp. 100]